MRSSFRQLGPAGYSMGDPAPTHGYGERPGPYRASDVREGESCELVNGHKIECSPAGTRHGESARLGAQTLGSDPAVHSAPVDLGIEFNDGKNLRAPDVAVGDFPIAPGWYKGVPPLCVEYADEHQDEADLKNKIKELQHIGVKYIWVVRLVGPLRVEVHERGKRKQLVSEHGTLTAPGVLQNPVPVRALVDAKESEKVTLRNLMQRQGYRGLDEALSQAREAGQLEGRAAGEALGRAKGKAESLLTILEARGIGLSPAQRDQILSCRKDAQLGIWLRRAASAATAFDVLDAD